jgi:hypothetical protein
MASSSRAAASKLMSSVAERLRAGSQCASVVVSAAVDTPRLPRQGTWVLVGLVDSVAALEADSAPVIEASGAEVVAVASVTVVEDTGAARLVVIAVLEDGIVALEAHLVRPLVQEVVSVAVMAGMDATTVTRAMDVMAAMAAMAGAKTVVGMAATVTKTGATATATATATVPRARRAATWSPSAHARAGKMVGMVAAGITIVPATTRNLASVGTKAATKTRGSCAATSRSPRELRPPRATLPTCVCVWC